MEESNLMLKATQAIFSQGSSDFASPLFPIYQVDFSILDFITNAFKENLSPKVLVDGKPQGYLVGVHHKGINKSIIRNRGEVDKFTTQDSTYTFDLTNTTIV